MTIATPYHYNDRLESNRLTTRFLKPADSKAWEEFTNDPHAMEFFPDSFFPGESSSATQWVNRQLQRYRDQHYGLQALISKSGGELVGQCGLLHQVVDGKAETEVGYHILKKHWGKGYAPEAARLFTDYVFTNNIAGSVISIIDVANVRSQRVAEKNGLVREKRCRWNGLDVFIYRIHNAQ